MATPSVGEPSEELDGWHALGRFSNALRAAASAACDRIMDAHMSAQLPLKLGEKLLGCWLETASDNQVCSCWEGARFITHGCWLVTCSQAVTRPMNSRG